MSLTPPCDSHWSTHCSFFSAVQDPPRAPPGLQRGAPTPQRIICSGLTSPLSSLPGCGRCPSSRSWVFPVSLPGTAFPCCSCVPTSARARSTLPRQEGSPGTGSCRSHLNSTFWGAPDTTAPPRVVPSSGLQAGHCPGDRAASVTFGSFQRPVTELAPERGHQHSIIITSKKVECFTNGLLHNQTDTRLYP